MIDRLDIFDTSGDDTRSFIDSYKSGSIEIQPALPLTDYKKDESYDEDIRKIRVYPQPPCKNPVTISTCPSSRPNYAKEAEEAAEEAKQAAALAEQYAEQSLINVENYAYSRSEIDEMLADIPDFDEVYTKTEVDELLAVKADIADLNDYYTKAAADALLAAKANSNDVYTKSQTYSRTEVNGLLADKADTSDLDDYYTKTAADALLAAKADSSDVYTKSQTYSRTEVNGLLADKADTSDLDDYYTKAAADALLAAKANSNDVYTKSQTYSRTEVNGLLADKADTSDLDDYYTKTAADALLAGKISTSEIGQAAINVSISWGGISSNATVKKSIEYTELKIQLGTGAAPSGITGNDTIGTLPEGYRPTTTRYFNIIARTVGGWTIATYYPAVLMIESNGVMRIIGNKNNLSTCQFLTGDIFYID